jgi:hypothetical protein
MAVGLTLRESIQAQINAAQATVDQLTAQLNTADKGMSALLSTDIGTVKAFFDIFGGYLK